MVGTIATIELHLLGSIYGSVAVVVLQVAEEYYLGDEKWDLLPVEEREDIMRSIILWSVKLPLSWSAMAELYRYFNFLSNFFLTKVSGSWERCKTLWGTSNVQLMLQHVFYALLCHLI